MKRAHLSSARSAEEVELKLLLESADVQAFRRLDILKHCVTERPRTIRLETTYFDTPEQYLRTHHLELRVRRNRKSWIQTLKTIRDATGGLHRRMEFETPVNGPQPDLAALATLVKQDAQCATALGLPTLEKKLIPVFGNVVRRTLWPLQLTDGTQIEVALDLGTLVAGDTSESISEVELELKTGSPAALYEFALQLQEKIALRINNSSKSARGYALMAPSPIAVMCAMRVELRPHMAIEPGFRRIVQNCLAQMQGNELGVIRGVDPESVHQMRVGLRRLRSALRLFSRWVPQPEGLRGELDWLTDALGAARDAEVFATSTLPALAATSPKSSSWAPLQQAASSVAHVHRLGAAEAVASDRYARLMLGLVAWVQTRGWQSALDGAARKALLRPLDRLAAVLITRLHQKLCIASMRLVKGSPSERHRVRIAAKRLRYATEFFQSLYRPVRFKRYVQRLAALQEVLGRINDMVVADGMLRQIDKDNAALANGTRFARKTLCTGRKKTVHAVLLQWKQFKTTKRP